MGPHYPKRPCGGKDPHEGCVDPTDDRMGPRPI